MYVRFNFKTKKAMREAVAEANGGDDNGKDLSVYQPGPWGGDDIEVGTVSLEGPHYPQAHRWYARVRVEGGRIVKVIT